MSDFKYYRPNNFPPIVKNLIIINILVWVAQIIFYKDGLTEKLALYPLETPFFKPYQIATHMFAHASLTPAGRLVFFHILFNMFALWMFGRILENVWGSKRFLFFYLASGVGAAACHLLVPYLQSEPSFSAAIGASGAVMGVMAAFAYLFPNTELYIMFIPYPIKAKWAVLGYVAMDLFFGINRVSGDNIARFAHLGGALTGFIIVYIWNKTNRKTLY